MLTIIAEAAANAGTNEWLIGGGAGALIVTVLGAIGIFINNLRKGKGDENAQRFDRLQKERDDLDERYSEIDKQRLRQIESLESQVRELVKAESACGREQARLQALVEGLTARIDAMAKLQEENTRLVHANATLTVKLEHAERDGESLKQALHACRNERSALPVLSDSSVAGEKKV